MRDWIGRIGALIAHAWEWLLDLCLVLWVARVGVLALLAVFAVFAVAPQAQDLFYYQAGGGVASFANILFWALFLAMVLVCWAMPLHYSPRLLLRTDRRFRALKYHSPPDRRARLTRFEEYLPRVLGAAAFLVVAWGAVRSLLNQLDTSRPSLDSAERAQIWILLVMLAAALALFAIYVVRRDAMYPGSWVDRLLNRIAAAPYVGGILDFIWGDMDARRKRVRAPRRLQVEMLSPRDLEGAKAGTILFLLLTLFVLAALVLQLGLFKSPLFPLALAVPFIAGGWVPVMSWLSHLGRRARAPFILGIFVAGELLALLLGNNHDVRLITRAQDAGARQISLNEALEAWRGTCQAQALACDRPVIVAAAGGASRAGYFTASVLGELLDRTGGRFGHQLFAISSVSGSSVGAALYAALWRDSGAGTQAVRRHCAAPGGLWHGTGPDDRPWRNCLEALASGDFLTPPFVGLFFYDLLRFRGVPWGDRGVGMEQAWEGRYEDVFAPGGAWGLEQSFSSFAPAPWHEKRAAPWRPLLLLNGASAHTGRRIVTSHLRFQSPDACHAPGGAQDTMLVPDDPKTRAAGPGGCRIFRDTYDFYELVDTDGGATTDVRLSTAAHNSARFPVVSPPGNLRPQGGSIRDRILDGGYVENFGIETALELARAVRRADPSLRPFILVISNDPELEFSRQDLNGERGPPVGTNAGLALPDIRGPLKGILSARTARGPLAVLRIEPEMLQILGETGGETRGAAPGEPTMAFIGIAGAGQCEAASGRGDACGNKPVSMSWWLSRPVQRYLTDRVLSPANLELLDIVAGMVRPAQMEPAQPDGR